MSTSRKEFIRNSFLLAGAAGFNIPSPSELSEKRFPNAEGDRLVLLGTQGGPFIRSYTQTPSANLIVYKDIPFVIDTGYGTTFKLKEAGINLSTLKYIFITHLHSDHYLDLGPLLYNAWIAGLTEPINVYAPAGIRPLLNAYWESNRFDIDTRIKDEGRPDIRNLVIAYEITEGIQVAHPDFEISAIKNIHPPIDASYAFKFKLGKKIIVFSGDTAYHPALATFASGADYLIHEVMYSPAVDEIAKRRPNATKLIASIKSHHTSAEDVGRIAKAANVKTLILNHFVPPDDKSLNNQIWIDAVRSTFTGTIIVGKDLQQFNF
ncbi:MBL fold metallo-hydrolase [Chitinophaga alhagiae]|uniref:MBL fold metallo-hydrolase n=1 Tax=Chitinophaga alhagiae TaxID=2203219 RepID=A0ABM6WAB2_9BACT|nr:MBL fold metallo-hydrolase [Chitinophaga alhagiae]AWO00851.1 MBL fold metallo-hydrolase [Chitinophaga alhagiae]